MKLPKLLETLTRTPLLMAPGAAESILALFQQHAALPAEDFAAKRTGKDFCGNAVDLEQMAIEDGTAIIPIKGPLGIGLGDFEKGAGATDYEDIIKDLRSAGGNDLVKRAILYFDSPGGMMGGLPETTGAIEDFRDSGREIYSFVGAGGAAASAAYWLAAATDGIFLSPSAQAGSIGVYCAYYDVSEAMARRGVKIRCFTSGTYKGMGVPGTSLTPEQESYLQEQVMAMADEFYSHVKANRSGVRDEDMQGQMFRALDAVKRSFADEVVKDLDALKRLLG